MNITLIGMPGSGKSCIGGMLAERLGFAFIDTDKVLEERYGMPLQSVLEMLGERTFLDEEASSVISALRGRDGLVLAPGGSVIYRENAMQALATRSSVAYLRVTLPTIEERIAGIPRGIVGTKTLGELFAERIPLYEKWATLTVDAEQASEEIVEHIVAALSSRGLMIPL